MYKRDELPHIWQAGRQNLERIKIIFDAKRRRCMHGACIFKTQLDHLQVGRTGLLTVTVDDGDGGGDEGADERVSASGRGGSLPAVAGKQRRLELAMALLLLVHYYYYISKKNWSVAS